MYELSTFWVVFVFPCNTWLSVLCWLRLRLPDVAESLLLGSVVPLVPESRWRCGWLLRRHSARFGRSSAVGGCLRWTGGAATGSSPLPSCSWAATTNLVTSPPPADNAASELSVLTNCRNRSSWASSCRLWSSRIAILASNRFFCCLKKVFW